jgi:hypothetical protein
VAKGSRRRPPMASVRRHRHRSGPSSTVRPSVLPDIAKLLLPGRTAEFENCDELRGVRVSPMATQSVAAPEAHQSQPDPRREPSSHRRRLSSARQPVLAPWTTAPPTFRNRWGDRMHGSDPALNRASLAVRTTAMFGAWRYPEPSWCLARKPSTVQTAAG